MSVSDPLLKDLKGHAGKLLIEFAEKGKITDECPNLQPFCKVLERIFQQGLNESFSLKRPDCWTWLENIASPRFSAPYLYSSAVALVQHTSRVQTDRGRFRLLIRACLVKKSLHFPIEMLVQHQSNWHTYQATAILGDEILSQILLSVLLQCSKLKFALHLGNCLFLDETWTLAPFDKLEFVPCKELGLCVSFNGGIGALVVRVENAGVAAEDDKVLIGDVVTEINSHEITTTSRTKLNSIMREAAGAPVRLSIIRARCADGKIYPPIQRLLLKHDIRLETTEAVSQIKKTDDSVGYPAEFIGCTSVGSQGDVGKISNAITKVVAETQEKRHVEIEIMEMGVRIGEIDAKNIIFQHTYMEISSCGKSERLPEYFAYIAGDTTSCNTATDFMCYVFYSTRGDHIANIVYSIAQGFQRTHWAV